MDSMTFKTPMSVSSNKCTWLDKKLKIVQRVNLKVHDISSFIFLLEK